MTLSADEFIRRFLLHVLPEGFKRIRYYGFLCNRYREQKLKRCRELLGAPSEPPPTDEPPEDYRAHYRAVTGVSLTDCPACGHGHMIFREALPKLNRRGCFQDTS